MKPNYLRTARVIWLGIFCSVLAFVGLRPHAPPAGVAPDASLLPILAAAALSLAVLSFIVPARVHAQATRALGLETREAPSVVTPDAPSATKRVFANPDKARSAAPPVYQTSFVLSLALSEAVGLLGLVLAFRGFADEKVLPFFGLSLVLLGLRFPRESVAEKALEKSAGATFGPSLERPSSLS